MTFTTCWPASTGLLVALLPSVTLADHPALAFGAEGGGPANTIVTSLPARGTWSAGLRSEYIHFDRFGDAALEDFAAAGNEDVHSVDSLASTSLSLAYGMTDDLTLSARIAYLVRDNIRAGEPESGVPEVHVHGDARGIGDLVLLGQYRFLDGDRLDASLLGGIKAPTGVTGRTDNDGARQEVEFQPGTGSWDVLFGASFSTKLDHAGVHGNVLYTLTGAGARGTESGDALFCNLALTWPLQDAHDHAGHDHAHGHFEWSAMLELNGERRSRNRIGTERAADSGGELLYVSPGLRLSAGNAFSAFVSVGIPVHERLNGIQTATDYRIVSGIGMAW